MSDTKARAKVKRFYVYIHCRPDGTPFYVGKGQGKRSHSFNGYNAWHKRVVAKYGKDNILVYVFPCTSEAQACADEIQHIAQLRSDGFDLCNLSDGGESGNNGCTPSQETRAKMSSSHIGKNTWSKGRQLSPEHIARSAAARTGLKQSTETCSKRAAAMMGNTNGIGNKSRTGMKNTPEHIVKSALAAIGNKSRTGQTQSSEERAKKSAALMGNTRTLGKTWSAERRQAYENRKSRHDT